jgi:hypothetical protein
MKTLWTAGAALLLLATVGCGGDDAPEGSGVETSHAGRGIGAWMKDYWAWSLSGTGEGRADDRVFLPLPMATDPDMDGTLTGEIDVTLQEGEGFMLPMFVWIGETYEGGAPADDDPAMFPDALFTGEAMDVTITLDGETILSSETDDLTDFFSGMQTFDPRIDYATPIEYAPDVHAIAAIWLKGIGFLHGPLSPGEHTLHLVEHNSDAMVGFDNTFHITVE